MLPFDAVSERDDITRLLRDPESGEELYSAVYDRLRRLARGRLRGRPSDATLGTTALVNEAYVKLVDQEHSDFNDRNHFFAVAATAMRQIIIDDARAKMAAKRGAGQSAVELEDERVGTDSKATELIALDAALTKLAEIDPRLVKVVEMRFFAGYSTAEIAEATGTSERTVKRDWRKARALLYGELM